MVQPSQLRVSSSWIGMGIPWRKESSLLLAFNENRGVVHCQSLQSERLDDSVCNQQETQLQNAALQYEQVERLIAAIQEPIISTIDQIHLGFSEDWLAANAEETFSLYRALFGYRHLSHWIEQTAIKRFKEKEVVARALESHYRNVTEDDRPEMQVVILLENGDSLVVKSRAQHDYMIPWTVTDSDCADVLTYNRNISISLLALLPEEFANQKLLSGIYLSVSLMDWIVKFVQKGKR
jgi:hypothetical protein